jgi:hypothetical protein
MDKSKLPSDGCLKAQTQMFTDPNRSKFEDKINAMGRIGVVYKIRRYVINCWDLSYDDRGVILIDADYKAIDSYKFSEILEWIK